MTSGQCSNKSIDGKAFAEGLRRRITEAAAELTATHGLTPGLAVVLTGDDPASHVYVRSKEKATLEVGFRSVTHRLSAVTTQAELLALVQSLNADPGIHGILVQLPLPSHLDPAPIIEAIDPMKDVDGLTHANISLLWSGGQGLFPCTPLGCLLLLKATLGRLDGLHAVVLGRSALVGKPVAALLLRENCTVSIAHSRSQDVAGLCRTGEILVSATGHAELVRGSWIKPGATVIDVGISRVETAGGKPRLVGDVAFEEALQVAGAITPVPGGVGPMTIACLLRNTLSAACRQAGIADPPV